MNRAERRAAEAAQAASEAGRTLQAAGQAKASESLEPNGDDAPQPLAPKLDDTRQRMLEGMYEGRKKKASEGAADSSGLPPPGLPPEEAKVQTEEERAEEEAIRKATKAREDAAKQQQKKDEENVKKDVAPQQDEPAPVAEPAAAVEPAAPTTSKQKVDGVEYDVPLAEIEEAGSEKAWRLNKAAENRLAKSNEVVAKAQAQIAAWMQQNAPKPTPQPTAEEVLRNLAANRFGTDEEFASNFKTAIGQLVPQIDQNQIILQATASIKRDQANAKFSKDFSDVLVNPVIKKVAGQLELEAMSPYVQNGVINWAGLAQLDWETFYSTIGVQLKGAVGPRQSQPAAASAVASASGTPSQLSEKEARKASIVNLPQAAAARAVAPAEEKPETREEALTRMRKSRGIPTG